MSLQCVHITKLYDYRASSMGRGTNIARIRPQNYMREKLRFKTFYNYPKLYNKQSLRVIIILAPTNLSIAAVFVSSSKQSVMPAPPRYLEGGSNRWMFTVSTYLSVWRASCRLSHHSRANRAKIIRNHGDHKLAVETRVHIRGQSSENK